MRIRQTSWALGQGCSMDLCAPDLQGPIFIFYFIIIYFLLPQPAKRTKHYGRPVVFYFPNYWEGAQERTTAKNSATAETRTHEPRISADGM